jgi:hypothetical protein
MMVPKEKGLRFWILELMGFPFVFQYDSVSLCVRERDPLLWCTVYRRPLFYYHEKDLTANGICAA